MGRQPAAAKLWPLAVLLGVLTPFASFSAGSKTLPEPLYRGLDGRGQETAARAVQKALETRPSNMTIRWSDPRGENSGEVTPLRTFRIASGHYCREFLETVATADRTVAAKRVACRNGEGRWLKVVE